MFTLQFLETGSAYWIETPQKTAPTRKYIDYVYILITLIECIYPFFRIEDVVTLGLTPAYSVITPR